MQASGTAVGLFDTSINKDTVFFSQVYFIAYKLKQSVHYNTIHNNRFFSTIHYITLQNKYCDSGTCGSSGNDNCCSRAMKV